MYGITPWEVASQKVTTTVILSGGGVGTELQVSGSFAPRSLVEKDLWSDRFEWGHPKGVLRWKWEHSPRRGQFTLEPCSQGPGCQRIERWRGVRKLESYLPHFNYGMEFCLVPGQLVALQNVILSLGWNLRRRFGAVGDDRA